MELEQLKLLGLDVDKGLTYFGGDPDLYRFYINKMLKTDFPAVIRQKLAEDDVEGAFHAMHKLKALVGYVSFTRLEDIVYTMTETLREGKTLGVPDGLSYVDEELKNLRTVLNIQVD